MQKLYRNSFFPVAVTGAYLALIGLAVYMIDTMPKEAIGQLLMKWVPWGFRANVLLILAGLLICHRDIFAAFRDLWDRRGVVLLFLAVVGFLMVFALAPQVHRIYYDEDIYANIAQNIALTHQAGMCNYGSFEYDEYFPHWLSYNKQPGGWPCIVSLAFQAFGVNELYAFILNNLFLAGGVLTAFFVAHSITGQYLAGILAGLAFILIPHNLTWANTISAETSAGLFSGLTVLSLLVYLKTREDRHLFLLALLLPLTCQMRPESFLIIPWAFTAVLLISPRALGDRKTWTFYLLTFVFLLPHLLHLFATSGESWGAEGEKFSMDFFLNNLRTNGLYYLDNNQFPVLLTALALCGLLWARSQLRQRILLFLWFLPFWGIFLFFYAGSYKYGADVRFSLVSFMPLAVMAGLGGHALSERLKGWFPGATFPFSSLLVLVLVFSFLKFLPLVRQVGQEAWGARHDHFFAREFMERIPRRSIVLTHIPTMFLVWGQGAIQTYAGTSNPDLIENLLLKYNGHVYFHHNYWCNTKSEPNVRLCKAIGEIYELEKVASAREQDCDYGMYRILGKRKAGSKQ